MAFRVKDDGVIQRGGRPVCGESIFYRQKAALGELHWPTFGMTS